MKSKIFNAIISCVVAVTLLFANIVCVTAGDATTNIVGIKHYLNDTELADNDIVFVGEVFKTQLYAKIDEAFTSWGMALNFDESLVNLVSFEDNNTAVGTIVLGNTNWMNLMTTGAQGVKATIMTNWANRRGTITLNANMPYISNDNGYVWLYGAVQNQSLAANLPNETSLLELNFKAKMAGNPDIGLAVEGDERYDEGMKADGIMFAMNGAHLPFAEPSINSVVIKEKPDAPTVAWSDNKATWSDVVSRGFVVNLYKEGTTDPVATSEVLGADENEYDFSESLTTPGDYYFIVTAKGGTYGTDSEKSDVKNITIPLAKPETPTWDTTTVGKLNWPAVDNAVDYEVIIYKKDANGDFVPYGEPIKVEGANSKELDDKLSEVGEYKATVKALDTGTGYTVSDPSDYSAIFYSGTNVNGYVRLDHLDDLIQAVNADTVKTDGEKALKIAEYNAKNGGMTIALYKASSDTLYAETTSNADGSFAIPTIPSGNYDIVISADGVITRIIQNVGIEGENFVLSTEDAPVEIWPGNVYIDDDTEKSASYPYGATFVNPADLALMINLLGTGIANPNFLEKGDFDYDDANQVSDLNIIIKYAGRNSVPGDIGSYPDWVIPQQ